MAKKYSQDALDNKAIALVQSEKRRWEEATTFVTDRVAFQMRALIRLLRKNYWGIFDYPTDPQTSRKKTWVPLTQSTVEDVVKAVDMDSSDIKFIAKNEKGYAITDLIRSAVQDYLKEDRFGEKIDELARDLAIDGTAVWKTLKDESKEGEGRMCIKKIDLLNIYIDPTENNIQDAYRFTERSIMIGSDFAKMTGWRNNDIMDMNGSTQLSRIDSAYKQITPGTTAEYRDCWEMWGKIPKSMITRDSKDEKTEIDGHIVVSGLEVGGPTCHLIEENPHPKGLKPYEEVRYSKIGNRWYGVGVAERLMWLQIWLNTIVNMRINRSYVSQLGLFKIRKGSGVTPAMLSRLAANGAVLVNDLDDIMPLDMPAQDMSSYTDEKVINDWAQKVTSAYNIMAGAPTAASSTATANNLQNTNAKTAFTLVKEAMSQFLERWMNNHALPIIAETISKGDIIRFSASDEQFQEIVQRIVAFQADEKLEESYEAGYIPTAETLARELANAEQKIMKQGSVFVNLVDELVAEHVDTRAVVSKESLDTGVMVNNLIQTLQLAPEYKDSIIREVYDLMGLTPPKQPVAPQMGGMPGSTQQGVQTPQGAQPSAQRMATNGNVANQQGLTPKL